MGMDWLKLRREQILSRVAWGCPKGETSPSWPMALHHPTHLMIHHTAISVSSSAGPEAVRAIWHFHALERGWGDIGYHFLIDPSGRIYAGRAGGITTIGGHFKGGNRGTLGVALLGNFMTEAVPEAA